MARRGADGDPPPGAEGAGQLTLPEAADRGSLAPATGASETARATATSAASYAATRRCSVCGSSRPRRAATLGDPPRRPPTARRSPARTLRRPSTIRNTLTNPTGRDAQRSQPYCAVWACKPGSVSRPRGSSRGEASMVNDSAGGVVASREQAPSAGAWPAGAYSRGRGAGRFPGRTRGRTSCASPRGTLDAKPARLVRRSSAPPD